MQTERGEHNHRANGNNLSNLSTQKKALIKKNLKKSVNDTLAHNTLYWLDEIHSSWVKENCKK